MKFQPRFLRDALLLKASLLTMLALAAFQPVYASGSQANPEAERYVLDMLQQGEFADLSIFPEGKNLLSASFIARLLTGRDTSLRIHLRGVWISDAVITGVLDLEGREVSHDVSFVSGSFEDFLDLSNSHFAKSLDFTWVAFKGGVDFSGTTVGLDFVAKNCIFTRVAVSFDKMRVAREFNIADSTFDCRSASFQNVRVGGSFVATNILFASTNAAFNNMRVDGSLYAENCRFTANIVSFIGAHFADVFMNRCTFLGNPTVDFTRMQADLISLDGIAFQEPITFKTQTMTFKFLTPANTDEIQFLLSHYDAEFYANLEASFRTHGYPDQADIIFIAKKRAERRENCKDFLRQCNRGAWALSLFEDMLAGYGKSLQNLLYWSLGFLIVGVFVFRSEKGMRTKDGKDAENYEGKYHAFWYSLDLFLPIIKLGEADVWTPKDDRRWANLYRKVHIIIGSLFVPIGLAAWTGIIK